MTEPRSHPALSEDQRDPDGTDGTDAPDALPASEPDDNPDDLTVSDKE
ncbi:hypothetical protein QP166_18090 [Sphingomonas sp. LR60]